MLAWLMDDLSGYEPTADRPASLPAPDCVPGIYSSFSRLCPSLGKILPQRRAMFQRH